MVNQPPYVIILKTKGEGQNNKQPQFVKNG